MDSFLKLLEITTSNIINQENLSNINSGEAFEKYVVKVMKELASNNSHLPSQDNIKQTGTNAFPDIVVDGKFGVEVKFSKSGKWESLGNSIFEGTSVGELEEIYILFGRKNNNKIEVLFKRYEDCLIDVKVTHSPRFIVSMEEDSSSIFENLDVPYSEFKEYDKIKKGKHIKEYFRRNLKAGQEVWFLDNEESETSVTINSYKSLSLRERRRLIIEAFILFPEVFSNSSSKYAGVATYWITEYQVYNSALRDIFSADGRKTINFPDRGETVVSKIYKNLYNFSQTINDCFIQADDEFINLINEKWNLPSNEANKLELMSKWLETIDKIGANPSPDVEELKPSDVFKVGLLKE